MFVKKIDIKYTEPGVEIVLPFFPCLLDCPGSVYRLCLIIEKYNMYFSIVNLRLYWILYPVCKIVAFFVGVAGYIIYKIQYDFEMHLKRPLKLSQGLMLS